MFTCHLKDYRSYFVACMSPMHHAGAGTLNWLKRCSVRDRDHRCALLPRIYITPSSSSSSSSPRRFDPVADEAFAYNSIHYKTGLRDSGSLNDSHISTFWLVALPVMSFCEVFKLVENSVSLWSVGKVLDILSMSICLNVSQIKCCSDRVLRQTYFQPFWVCGKIFCIPSPHS